MTKTNCFLIALFLCLQGFAQTSGQQEKKPLLIVGITVEQMRYECLDLYWNTFRSDGFKRLLTEGAVCGNTRLDLQSINAAT